MLGQPQRGGKGSRFHGLLLKQPLKRDAATAPAGLEAAAAHLAVRFHAASECAVSCGALMPPAMLVKVGHCALPCAGVQCTLLCSLRCGHQVCFVVLVINAPCPAQAFTPHRQPILEMLLCSLRCGHQCRTLALMYDASRPAQAFKPHLEPFLEPLFRSLRCGHQLCRAAAGACLGALRNWLGPRILAGRLSEDQAAAMAASPDVPPPSGARASDDLCCPAAGSVHVPCQRCLPRWLPQCVSLLWCAGVLLTFSVSLLEADVLVRQQCLPCRATPMRPFALVLVPPPG